MNHLSALKPIAPYALPLLAGWIAAFAMPPAGLWPCLFIGLSVLFHQWMQAASHRRSFLTGFLFGIGFFTTGLWWIGNALLIEGNEFWWVWPISVIGLPVLLSLFTGLFCALARLAFKTPRLSAWIGFAAALTLSEWTRGHIFTGFPWNLYGYGWGYDPLMYQSASLYGAYGLTFITVLLASAPAALWLLRADKRRMIVIGAASLATLAGLAGYGAWRLSLPVVMDGDAAVRVVQANIHQTLKWDAAQIVPNFERHIDLSYGQPPAPMPEGRKLYIVWPETAIPPELIDHPQALDRIETMLAAQGGQAVLLTGAMVARDDRYFNALLAFDKRADIRASYAKTHLVPFGEFIPFQEWIPLRPVVRFQGFTPGDGPKTYAVDDMPRFSPLVCYEIIFPGRAAEPGNRPDLLVAVTNDGWYGESAGPFQHFFQARIRSIEEGLPTARSANTGISGVIDPYGRVLARSGLFEAVAIDHALPAAAPPTVFSRTGDIFWFCLILSVFAACALYARLRR